MKKISEQIDQIKEEMCDTRCKWLEKANMVRLKSPKDIDMLKNTLEEMCKGCPLNRL